MAEALVNPLRIHADAMRELDAAIGWYNQRQFGLGLALHTAAQSILDRIAENPLGGMSSGRHQYRYWRTPRFPYAIYWVELHDTTWVIAIAHTRQRPDYWKHRSPDD